MKPLEAKFLRATQMAPYYKEEFLSFVECIEAGVNVNIKNGSGYTPLIFACRENQFDMVEVLIENHRQIGLNANLTNKHDYTAFMYACMNGCYEIVDLFIKNHKELNLDVNHQSKKTAKTALMFACEGNHANVIKLLLDNRNELKLDFSAERRGRTALEYISNPYVLRNIVYKTLYPDM